MFVSQKTLHGKGVTFFEAINLERYFPLRPKIEKKQHKEKQSLLTRRQVNRHDTTCYRRRKKITVNARRKKNFQIQQRSHYESQNEVIFTKNECNVKTLLEISHSFPPNNLEKQFAVAIASRRPRERERERGGAIHENKTSTYKKE